MSRSTLTVPMRARIIAATGSDQDIARETGVPRRTVSATRLAYRKDPDHWGPEVRRLVEAQDADTLPRLRRLSTAVLDELERRVNDPATRTGELVTAFRELRGELTLREGRATQRVETTAVTDYWERQEALREGHEAWDRILAMSDDELDAWIVEQDALRQLRDARRAVLARDVTPAEAVP